VRETDATEKGGQSNRLQIKRQRNRLQRKEKKDVCFNCFEKVDLDLALLFGSSHVVWAWLRLTQKKTYLAFDCLRASTCCMLKMAKFLEIHENESPSWME
jgi:hypothetical protein